MTKKYFLGLKNKLLKKVCRLIEWLLGKKLRKEDGWIWVYDEDENFLGLYNPANAGLGLKIYSLEEAIQIQHDLNRFKKKQAA